MKKHLFYSVALFLLIPYFINGQSEPTSFSVDIDALSLKSQLQVRESYIDFPYHPSLKQIQAVPNHVFVDDIGDLRDKVETYDLVQNGKFVGTYTWTTHGIWLYANVDGKAVSIYPNVISRSNRQHTVMDNYHLHIHGCESHHSIREVEHDISMRSPELWGSTLRNYDMAIATTGEFYQANGNNDNAVRMAVVQTVQGLTALYKRELSISFSINNSRIKLYKNPANDPFDAEGEISRPVQAGRAIKDDFSIDVYDIGHVVHTTASGGSGVALRGAVCRNSLYENGVVKACGWSGSSVNAGFEWIALMGHELAHMFDASHIFNGSGGFCQDAIAEEAAYEIGSGTTIMSYNTVCEEGQQVPPSGEADNYFNVHNLIQMVDYINEQDNCSDITQSNNALPVVNANPCDVSFSIPKGTPFYIQGEATDEDDSDLLYCWEQADEDGATSTATQGKIGTAAANDFRAPLNRSYPPSDKNYRYIPSVNDISAGVNNPFDVLSNRPRTLHYKLTVRDQNASGTAVAYDELAVEVENVGPLRVSNIGNVAVGDNIDIQWNPNGSEELCDKVKILLSNDGGRTFPFLIAENIDYGSETYAYQVSSLLPESGDARIKIVCDDYECVNFYNVSNKFNIANSCSSASVICPTMDIEADFGSLSLNTNSNIISGELLSSWAKSINSSSPIEEFGNWNADINNCNPLNPGRTASVEFQVSESGTYVLGINEDAIIGTIYRTAQRNSSNSCSGFVSSSAIDAGGGSFIPRSSITAELQACESYTLVARRYTLDNVVARMSLSSGPGVLFQLTGEELNPYFVAVSKKTGLIKYVNTSSNFTTLGGGEYTVFGVSIPEGTAPESLLNQNIANFQSEDCYGVTSNSFDLTINSDCKLLSATLGDKGECQEASNSFNQDVILEYAGVDGADKIIINGDPYDITTSPQTISVDLPSDGGNTTLSINLQSEEVCILELNVENRQPCCPFDLELGEDLQICQGKTIDIDAGDGGANGGSYQWTKDGSVLSETGSVLTVVEPGEYMVMVTNADGCSETDRITVQETFLPELVLFAPDEICEGSTVRAQIDTDGNNIVWTLNGQVIAEGFELEVDISEGGLLEVESFNGTLCSVKESKMIEVIAIEAVDIGPDVSKCSGEEAVLNANIDGVYTWYLNGTSIGNTSSVTIDATGEYVLKVEQGECFRTDTLQAFFEEVPTLEAPENVNLCENETATIDITTSSQVIKWYLDGVLLEDETGSSIEISEGGQLRVVAGASENCNAEQVITITTNEVPQPDLGDDKTGCIGQSITLDAQATGDSYIWKKDGLNITGDGPTLGITESGVYAIEINTSAGCKGTSSVNVSFLDSPTIELPEQHLLCSGTEVELIANTSANTITWLKDGAVIPDAGTTSLEVNEAGTYKIIGSFNGACEVEAVTVVDLVQSPTLDLGANIEGCEGDELILQGPNGGYNFQWIYNGTVIGDTRDLSISEPGSYVLEISDDNNCKASDEIQVALIPYPEMSLVNDVNSICEGEETNIVINTNGENIQWYLNDVKITGITGTSFSASESGMYKITSENSVGCETSIEVALEVIDNPDIDLGEDVTVCEGETVNLEAATGYASYLWQYNGSTVGENENYAAEAPGKYTITVTNEEGCMTMDEIEIFYTAPPELEVENSLSICIGEFKDIIATSNAATFRWYKDENLIPGENTGVIKINEGGTYTVQAINGNNCLVSEEILVTAYESPVVDLGDDLLHCPGTSLELDAGNDGDVYAWSNGSMEQVVNIEYDENSTEKIFTVAVTNEGNCTTVEEIKITTVPIAEAQITSPKDFVCQGDSLVLKGSGTFQLSWSSDSDRYEAVSNDKILVYPTSSTVYTLTVENECEDTDMTSITIDVLDASNMKASPDTCVLKGNSIDLYGEGGVKYNWQEDPTIIDDEEGNIITVQPEVETTYFVTITDGNGCKVDDQVVVCVIEDIEDIIKPISIITPNNDGKNDELYFEGLELFNSNELNIYNRWGQIVYSAQDYQKSGSLFNGSVGFDELPPDTYYYVLKFDQLVLKSSLTIIREK